jgi:cobalt/nickel transport system permease protein
VLSLAGALLLVALARLPARWYLARLATALPFLALFALPLPFLLTGPGPAWRWGPLTVSAHGVAAAVLILCKGTALVTLTVVLLATAPLDALLQAARSLRVPGLVVQLGLLTYRYLFVLADEFGRLRAALRVRGFRNRPTRHGYRTLGQVAGTLLVRGHDRSERVAQAMRCRGFDGRYRSLAAFRAGPVDVLAFGLIATAGAAVVTLDWLWS